MRQVIRLHCCSVFVYIYISVPVNPRHLDCAITSCSSLAHNTTTSSTSTESEQIFAHKHFNALGGIHIFAGIANSRLGPTWFLPVGHFGLHHSTHMTGTAFSREGGEGGIQVHPSGYALGRVQRSGCQLRSRNILYMVKTKDLYSAYCPTGGCTHHPPFCSSLSPARLLHSYVCPSCIVYLLVC